MKKLLALILVVLMVVGMFAGCQPKEKDETSTPATQPDAPSGGGVPDADPDEPDWNAMSSEDLYKLALEEGGIVNVYCDTSKMASVCETFAEDYPGLKAEAYELADEEIMTKVKIESDSGNPNGDILVAKDVNGDIWYSYAPQGYITTYYPEDIVSHIANKELLDYGMPFYSAMTFWYYNTAQNPNGSPITNWWDVVEMDEDGKSKYLLLCEGFTEITYLSFMCMMITRADEMAEAYKLKYGKDIEYTYDASKTTNIPENNAGYEFLYRLAQIEKTYIDDGDDIVKGVHDASVPAIGLTSGGKISNRDDEGWNIDWCLNLEPFTNFQNTVYCYPISDTDNPAASRLFIRYLLGDTDGKGKGFDPFTKEGNWPVRDDVVNSKNNYTLADLGSDPINIEAVYSIYPDAEEFWIYWENEFLK